MAFHQVHIGYHLCDRVLHLDPRVHFDEVQAPVLIHQELDGARVPVSDLLERCAENLTNFCPQFWTYLSGGRLLQQLLMASLDRALALSKADHTPVLISQDLELDMPGMFDVFLHVEIAVAKCACRLRLCRLK